MARPLYPAIQTFNTQWITTVDNQQIYVEQSGNPKGIAVIYLHGGPGAGCSEHYRRYFDPEIYHIILYDQRGCGRSKPSPTIENNTTDFLLDDLELIRKKLGITQWLVCGGSWGSTLALLYAIKYPNRVLGLILRGIFLATEAEYQWLYSPDGAARFFPEYYQEFIEPIRDYRYTDPVNAYNIQLNTHHELAAIAACKSWYLWEARLSSLDHPAHEAKLDDMHQALCMAKISSHYFANHCFIPENYILQHKDRLSDITAIVIHGRYDMVCQLTMAYQLVNGWDKAELAILPHAGHSGFEQQTIEAFCKATDNMARFILSTK
jgi:proline iminopeptidase